MKQELSFRSQARIVRTLGDRLITGEVTAIIELVKNSYDADASSCYIEINPHDSVLTIKDNGHGMSLSDIETKWAELGTDNKYRDSVTKSGRVVLGNKGIGRLAAAKLGRYLEIESTTHTTDGLKTVKVSGIDWNAFSENEKNYIEDIKFYVEEWPSGETVGTKLVITELNQVWDKDRLLNLIYEMRKLISPIVKKEHSFDIYLNLDAFTQNIDGFDGSELVNGASGLINDKDGLTQRNRLEPFSLLDACDYTFSGTYIDNKLQGMLRINDDKVDVPINVDLEENIKLGKGSFNLNIFDRDADSIKNSFVRAGLISKEDKTNFKLRDARRLLNDLSGIAIYRNGFRIRPYGDKDADWLGLDKRRVQNPSKNIEQAQISGIILVDDVDKSGLIERSSREGFEHNDNFNAFKRLFLKALNEVEIRRFSHNKQIGKNRNQATKSAKVAFLSLRAQANLSEIVKFSDRFADKEKKEFEAVVIESKTKLDQLINIIQERQAALEVKTTLGFIIAEVLHEARHPISAVGANLISLSKRVSKKWHEDIKKEVANILLTEFKTDIQHINDLDSLFDRLKPLLQVRSKKKYRFSVYGVVEKALLLLRDRINANNVKIKHAKPQKDYKMDGLEEDIYAAIMNLLDNSLYWHKQRNIDNPFISINYAYTDDVLTIFIEDNAGGISENYEDSIFDVGFTTKEGGSGLGLSIAREALGRAGASIRYSSTPNHDGSLFIIEISGGVDGI